MNSFFPPLFHSPVSKYASHSMTGLSRVIVLLPVETGLAVHREVFFFWWTISEWEHGLSGPVSTAIWMDHWLLLTLTLSHPLFSSTHTRPHFCRQAAFTCSVSSSVVCASTADCRFPPRDVVRAPFGCSSQGGGGSTAPAVTFSWVYPGVLPPGSLFFFSQIWNGWPRCDHVCSKKTKKCKVIRTQRPNSSAKTPSLVHFVFGDIVGIASP